MSDIVLPNTIRSPYLVDFRAGDLSLTCRTGQAATLSRTGDGYALDANGLYHKSVQHQERWGYFGGVPHLLLEAGRTNEDTDSCDFSAGSDWGAGTNFTISTATSVILGQTAYKHVNDNGGVNRARSQAIGNLTANPETLYFIVENVDALITTIGISDTIAGDWVARAAFTYATESFAVTDSGVGSAVSTYAHQLANSGPNGGAVWLLVVTATPDNSGNGRQDYIYPSGTTQNALSSIIHHAQHEEAASASSPIITTTAAASRAADTFSIPYNAPVQELTAYAKFVEMGSIVTTDARIMQIGDNTDPRFLLGESGGAGAYRALYDEGATSYGSGALSTAPSIGAVVELRAVLSTSGVLIGQSIAGGAEETASSSGPSSLSGAWSDAVVYLNSVDAAARGLIGLREFRIALGTKTLAQMRAAV